MAIEKVMAKRTLGIYVKDTASDEDLFAVGQSLSTLMAKDLVEVTITEKSTLTQGM